MKRILYFLIPAVVLTGLIVWRLNVKRQQAAQQQQASAARKKAPVVVSVAVATKRDIVHSFEGVGTVESPLNVKISPKVTGRLDYLLLREGDRVTQGEVVARIDPSEVLANVRQQQANAAEAQSRLAQAQFTANPTNVSVTTQISQQQAAVSSSSANLNQVTQNYNAQVAVARAAVTDGQGKVDNALAAIASANAGIGSARANLNNAQVKYNRTYSLYKQGFVAAQDVDDARTQVSVQQGNQEVAQGQLGAANALRDSALAQKDSAQQQISIVSNKGKADIEAGRASVRQARAALEYARSNTAQKPAYQANLAALRSAVTAAQAQVANAQSQLADTNLRSAISGFVTARYMDPGAVATAGTPVLQVAQLSHVYVTTSIPEEFSRNVRVGMPAQAHFDAIPGRAYEGRISQFNPAADPQSRQFIVRLTLNNPESVIKPGMFARVTMVTEQFHNLVVVPREAVKPGKNGATVTVVDNNLTAHVRSVQTGAQDALGIAILKGVQPGERVVTLTLLPVKDGQKVSVAPATGSRSGPRGGAVAGTGAGGR